MSSLAALEAELAEAISNVETCQTVLATDPNDEDALGLRSHYEQETARLKGLVATAKAKQGSVPPPPPASDEPPPPPPQDAAAPASHVDDVRTTFKTGDTVLAKYSEDKQWYPASIISKTGSSTDPLYTVSFTGYGNKETKRKFDVRAIENKNKRKADGPPSTTNTNLPSTAATTSANNASTPTPFPAPPTPTQDGTVISAAPSVDPSLVHKREPSKVSDGPTRMAPEPKRLKGSKALDKAKTSWMDWQKSGPKKAGIGGTKKLHKDSQFRTSDLPNAKVGFTGSGKPMQKDQARTKWTYGQVVEDDAE